jgi:hypothetical protein
MISAQRVRKHLFGSALGPDLGQHYLQVVTGRKSGERQVRKAPSAAERLEQLRSEAAPSSGVFGGAAAAVAAGAQRVQHSFTHGWAVGV